MFFRWARTYSSKFQNAVQFVFTKFCHNFSMEESSRAHVYERSTCACIFSFSSDWYCLSWLNIFPTSCDFIFPILICNIFKYLSRFFPKIWSMTYNQKYYEMNFLLIYFLSIVIKFIRNYTLKLWFFFLPEFKHIQCMCFAFGKIFCRVNLLMMYTFICQFLLTFIQFLSVD